MKLYVEGGAPGEIRGWLERGLIAGVSIEAAATSHDAILGEARAAAANAGHDVVICLPGSADRLAAARACASEGLAVAVTISSAAAEALAAADAGVRFVSPLLPRRADGTLAIDEATDLVRKIASALRTADARAEVLVAGLRNAGELLDMAVVGARAAIVPCALLEQVASASVSA